MIIALVVLGVLCLAQFALIFALTNRLLVQAKLPIMTLPHSERREETPEPTPRPVLMRIPVTD